MNSIDPRSVSQVDQVIGERIRARRQELGLTQVYVAEHVGVAQQQFQKYEAGESKVSVAALTRIAEVLQIDAAELLPPRSTSVRRRETPPTDGMVLQLVSAFERIQSAQERRLVLDLAKRFADTSATSKRVVKKKGRR